MLNYMLIGLGGAAGNTSRSWAPGLAANRFGKSFPWSCLVVSVTGAFTIAAFTILTARHGLWLVGPYGRNAFMTGFCGGYITVSFFGPKKLNPAQDDEGHLALKNAVPGLKSASLPGRPLGGHALAVKFCLLKSPLITH